MLDGVMLLWFLLAALSLLHERRWFLHAGPLQHVLSRASFDELSHGRHGARDDPGNEKCSGEPRSLGTAFWFIMSMALLVGFLTAYPMNWWLVSRHMKHGMITVRSPKQSVNTPSEPTGSAQRNSMPSMDGAVSNSVLTWMTVLSVSILGLGLFIAASFGG